MSPAEPSPNVPPANLPRTVRLPLVVGTSALWSILRALLAIAPLAFMLALAREALAVYLKSGAVPRSASAVSVGAVGLLSLATVVGELFRARQRRAADIVLDDRGITVEAGPLAGRSFPWTEVDRNSIRVDTTFEQPWASVFKLWGRSERELHSLTARLAGQPVVLARVDRKIEHASLDDLALTLRSTRLGVAFDAPMPAYAIPLHCTGCGAPLTPTSEPASTCRFCGTVTPQSDLLRQRIRAGDELVRSRARAERSVMHLITQPGARRINQMLAAALVLGALGYPLAYLALRYQFVEGSVRYSLISSLVLVPWAVAGAVALFARARLVDRLALPLLTVGFGARRGPRGFLVCRECGGPLPDVTRRALVRCVFCSADNVLGVDLTREATAARHEASGLDGALARRRRERLIWFVPGMVATLLLVGWTQATLTQGFTANRYTHSVQPDGRIDLEMSPIDRQIRAVSAYPNGLVLVAVHAHDDAWGLAVVDPAHADQRFNPRAIVEDRAIRGTTFVGSAHAAYISELADGRAALRLVALEPGAQPRTLLEGEALEHPSGSPGGDRVIVAKREAGEWGLYLLKVDGSSTTRLRDGRMPAWHPVSDRIAFVAARNGNLDLFELDIATPERVAPVLKPNQSDEVEPAYSPCGSHLVFATNDGFDEVRDGSAERTFNLWVIAGDGKVMKLTRGNAIARSPAWTPRRIWFESDTREPPWLEGLAVPGGLLGELYAGVTCPKSLDVRR